MELVRKEHKISVGQSERDKLLGKTTRRWQECIKMDIKKTEHKMTALDSCRSEQKQAADL
jgi:ribulose bisphosphate carboxylase small subunit